MWEASQIVSELSLEPEFQTPSRVLSPYTQLDVMSSSFQSIGSFFFFAVGGVKGNL